MNELDRIAADARRHRERVARRYAKRRIRSAPPTAPSRKSSWLAQHRSMPPLAVYALCGYVSRMTQTPSSDTSLTRAEAAGIAGHARQRTAATLRAVTGAALASGFVVVRPFSPATAQIVFERSHCDRGSDQLTVTLDYDIRCARLVGFGHSFVGDRFRFDAPDVHAFDFIDGLIQSQEAPLVGGEPALYGPAPVIR